MKLLLFIEFLRQRRKLLVRLSYVLLVGLVVGDALPFLVDKEPAHTRAEQLPGFWAGFGFVACLVIIFVSKWFGHAGIMQREDYYDE